MQTKEYSKLADRGFASVSKNLPPVPDGGWTVEVDSGHNSYVVYEPEGPRRYRNRRPSLQTVLYLILPFRRA